MTPNWRKSTYSLGENSDCVELARLNAGLGVRDSKALEDGHLTLSRDTFADLLAGVKRENGPGSGA
ncbi:DUF397 domain-containing protein [Actinomadura harenae]|uniref:DUF397 domain-containing protein n=1 Tax=Actinomadura harenae TaxID=2483351 RepID=A0A3M2M3W4_9ACTN|nr:DUF397 domain-containing protein [Actinomadura harenae]RMI43790.1 DUF397 domain-containing protein [Actinomadura harenae]